jgi:Flp pilus assembly pilin Flp
MKKKHDYENKDTAGGSWVFVILLVTFISVPIISVGSLIYTSIVNSKLNHRYKAYMIQCVERGLRVEECHLLWRYRD